MQEWVGKKTKIGRVLFYAHANLTHMVVSPEHLKIEIHLAAEFRNEIYLRSVKSKTMQDRIYEIV